MTVGHCRGCGKYGTLYGRFAGGDRYCMECYEQTLFEPESVEIMIKERKRMNWNDENVEPAPLKSE